MIQWNPLKKKWLEEIEPQKEIKTEPVTIHTNSIDELDKLIRELGYEISTQISFVQYQGMGPISYYWTFWIVQIDERKFRGSGEIFDHTKTSQFKSKLEAYNAAYDYLNRAAGKIIY